MLTKDRFATAAPQRRSATSMPTSRDQGSALDPPSEAGTPMGSGGYTRIEVHP